MSELKYIKIMAEYSSTGLWTTGGIMLDPALIPISVDLKQRINAWCKWYETNRDYVDKIDNFFDYSSFSKEGELIAIELKKELPIVKIEYVNEFVLSYANKDDINKCTYIEIIE